MIPQFCGSGKANTGVGGTGLPCCPFFPIDRSDARDACDGIPRPLCPSDPSRHRPNPHHLPLCVLGSLVAPTRSHDGYDVQIGCESGPRYQLDANTRLYGGGCLLCPKHWRVAGVVPGGLQRPIAETRRAVSRRCRPSRPGSPPEPVFWRTDRRPRTQYPLPSGGRRSRARDVLPRSCTSPGVLC